MILCGTCVLVRLCLKFTVAATAGSEWMEEKKENGICSWDLWWMANACASKHNRTSCRRIVSKFPQEKRRSGKNTPLTIAIHTAAHTMRADILQWFQYDLFLLDDEERGKNYARAKKSELKVMRKQWKRRWRAMNQRHWLQTLDSIIIWARERRMNKYAEMETDCESHAIQSVRADV